MTEDKALELLRERMVGQRVGDVSVVDVRHEYLINERAEEYLEITLILEDPPASQVTWSLDGVFALMRRGDAEAKELRIAPPFFVTFGGRPDPDDVSEDDEAVAA